MTTLALDDGNLVRLVLFGGGFLVALTVIVLNRLKSIAETREMEQTRREVAAYVAEGTMTPEDAEMILAGGKRRKCSGTCGCGRKKSSAQEAATAAHAAAPQQA